MIPSILDSEQIEHPAETSQIQSATHAHTRNNRFSISMISKYELKIVAEGLSAFHSGLNHLGLDEIGS